MIPRTEAESKIAKGYTRMASLPTKKRKTVFSRRDLTNSQGKAVMRNLAEWAGNGETEEKDKERLQIGWFLNKHLLVLSVIGYLSQQIPTLLKLLWVGSLLFAIKRLLTKRLRMITSLYQLYYRNYFFWLYYKKNLDSSRQLIASSNNSIACFILLVLFN